LRWYFEELKLDCSEAENGLDALQKAQQKKPDLVILDFSMPVMNGVEAARVFNQIMPGSLQKITSRRERVRTGSRMVASVRALPTSIFWE
jgi:CheY-like chemotaxis protein